MAPNPYLQAHGSFPRAHAPAQTFQSKLCIWSLSSALELPKIRAALLLDLGFSVVIVKVLVQGLIEFCWIICGARCQKDSDNSL